MLFVYIISTIARKIKQMQTELKSKLDELKQLNRSRYEYVIARSSGLSITDATDRIGVSRSWYYNYSQEERDEMERIAHELHHSQVVQAMVLLEQVALEAAQVKYAGLKSNREEIQQRSATEILDRVGVKVPEEQRVEFEGRITHRGLEQALIAIYGNRNKQSTDME